MTTELDRLMEFASRMKAEVSIAFHQFEANEVIIDIQWQDDKCVTHGFSESDTSGDVQKCSAALMETMGVQAR